MSNFGSAVAWLVLAPFALTTNVVAVVVVCHYRRQFHGSDAALISLFVTMTLHAVVALPVAAGVELGGSGWPPELCSFYVWLLVCVRMSQLLTTGVMNVHWMCILRFTSGQEVYSSAIVVKVLVCLAWFGGVVTGLVPVVGFGVYSYFQQFSDGGGRGECSFLPQGLSTSFVVFFFIVTLATIILSLVSSADTLAVFKYMRRTAVEKYKAGRFYLPSSSNAFSTSTSANGHDNARGQNAIGCHSGGGIDGRTIAFDEEEEIKQGGSPFVTSNGRIPNGEGYSHGLSSQTTAGGVLGRGPGEKNGQVAANSAAAIVVRPSGKSGVARSVPATVHARYNELNLSSELCRVVVCFTLLTALIQHLPFAVLQFIQLVQPVDRVSAQVVVLWLLLLEALTAPHVLWVLSRRYRHALVYVWTVHVLRDTSAKEEDPSACTLQSYTRRVQAPGGATVRVTARVRRGVTITGPVHEYQPNGQVRAYSREDDDPEGFSPDYTGATRRGAEIITTDLDDDLTVITDLASTKKRYIYHSPASERAAQASLQRPEAGEGSGGSSQTTSPSRLSVNSPTRPFDMRRSGSAREAWKEQMRKKHLPAVFVNDAFDAEEDAERGQDLVSDMHVLPDVALVGGDFDEVDSEAENVGVKETLRKTSGRRPPHHVINHHFHYDYQRSDGAPRVESESDGSSFQYDDRDIEIILDGHHGLHSGGSRSVLEKVVEAEAQRESNDDPVTHFAATTEGVLKDGYLGRVDSYGDSSEGSSTEKQSVRGRKKPPRRSSRTNRLKDQPSFVLEGEHDLEDRSDGTEEARAWTSQGEGLKQGEDEFVGREFFLYEADQSKQMSAYETQNDFNQYSSSVELDKEGFTKNFSRIPESVNTGLVSVAFSKNDFVKLQNITSDSTDADNIPDNVSVISTVKVSGDKNSSNKVNKVLMKDIFKDEFDEVAPHNPRKRTEVMDKDFDDVDEPRGTPTGNSVISAPWTPYAGGGNIKNGSHPSSRTRSSYFRRDVDSSKQMITMVDSDADLPDTAIVLDVLETSSSGSEHSVVLEPYYRRPLWLDDDDEQSQRNSAADLSISNPFRVSSGGYPFADPSREGQFKSQGLSSGLGNSFGGSFDAKGQKSYDLVNPFPNEVLETTSSSGAYSHDTFSSESDTTQSSGSSDQLSFLRDATSERLGVNGFDDEADRYHDNTMAIDYNIMIHPYYGSYPGLYFESIKEEPEDLSDSTLSGHTEDDAHGSTHGTLQSFSAESFGHSKAKPFLLNGDSTFQVQAISQTVNKDVAPPGRTSADGREAPTPDVCSTQRTGTLEPEDLPHWDDGAVSISTKQSNPSFQLLKVSPMMDHKVNGVRNFSNDLRTNLDLPRTANGDAVGALTDVTDDVLPRRKPPPPPRRSSISNDGPLTDSELQTHHSEASPVDPVYF